MTPEEGSSGRAAEPRPSGTPVFVPLRPVPRRRLVARALVGPLVWLVALLVAAVVVNRTDAIERGVLFAATSFAFSVVVLVALRAARRREERRHAHNR